MRLIDNKEKNRFETTIDGHDAFIEYSVEGDVISLNHTEVNKALAGKGVGGELTENVLLEIERRGLKVNPVCSFVAHYISKNPEWESVVSK